MEETNYLETERYISAHGFGRPGRDEAGPYCYEQNADDSWRLMDPDELIPQGGYHRRLAPLFRPMPCGHEAHFVVQADEGTAWCSLCELAGRNDITSGELAVRNAQLAAELREKVHELELVYQRVDDLTAHVTTLTNALGADVPSAPDPDSEPAGPLGWLR